MVDKKVGNAVTKVFEADSDALYKAVDAIETRGVELAEKPIKIIEQLEKSIEAGKGHLKEYQAMVDKFGEKLGEKAVFTKSILAAASETAGSAVSEAKGKLLVSEGLHAADAKTAAVAKEIGLLSETAYKDKGFFGQMIANAKANFAGAATHNSEGVIVSAEKSGILKKGIRGGTAAAGVVLMGTGLKDAFAPTVDENGTPQDVSWAKVAGEVAGGAALVGAGLLMGGGAKGRLA